MKKQGKEKKESKTEIPTSLEILIEEKMKEISSFNRRRIAELTLKHSKFEKDAKKLLKDVKNAMDSTCFYVSENRKQMASFEESLLYILHNIKKNQFLYAHYPEEWVKDYQALKDGLIAENEYMTIKGAVNE